jgi:hypothetical protein
MDRKETYFTHDELCEMLDVPKESGLLVDENALIWWPPAEMWRLSVKVGTKEEVEAAADL